MQWRPRRSAERVLVEVPPWLAPFLHFSMTDATGNLPKVVLKPR